MSEEQRFVRYAVDGNVAVIALNDGGRLNPIGTEMREGIEDALTLAEHDDNVGCIVLTGEGRAFSSGADMSGGPPATTSHEWYVYHEKVETFLTRVHGAKKPIVAAVNGMCHGLGLILAAHCDLVVASDKASFGLIESRMGSAGAGVFPLLIGAQWTKFLILTGETISAQKACEIGLVLAVVEDARLHERSLSLAQRIASMPRAAAFLNKRNVDGTLDIMGWAANRPFTTTHTAVVDAMLPLAQNARGEVLMDVLRTDGLRAFIKARDEALGPSWFQEDD